jgi:hypothetical protein
VGEAVSDLAAMARRIADDDLAPIHDRSLALNILHRLTLGLPVASRDAWRLRIAHGRRRRDAMALARWYGVAG